MPYDRRPRAILLGDEIFAKVGGYVLGNVVISSIIATATFIWLVSFGVPYPLLLAILVGLLDLIPVIGSVVAGVLVALAALTVSLPVCLATIGFFVAYKILEDYLLTPKVFGKVLKLPEVVTIVALLVGGALLGIVGALVGIAHCRGAAAVDPAVATAAAGPASRCAGRKDLSCRTSDDGGHGPRARSRQARGSERTLAAVYARRRRSYVPATKGQRSSVTDRECLGTT